MSVASVVMKGSTPSPRDDGAVDEADDEAGERRQRPRPTSGLAPGSRMTIAAIMPPRPSTDPTGHVDAAGQDDQRLADRHDADRRGLLQDVDEVRERSENGGDSAVKTATRINSAA